MLARAAGSLLKPQEALPWLVKALSLASYLCDKSRSLGRKVLISVSPERVSLEISDASVTFKLLCAGFSLVETFIEGDYEVPEVLSGLKGRDVIDVGASAVTRPSTSSSTGRGR
ncbi:MAG: hypothetical protein RXP86_08965 [Acidilobus sp.]